MKSFSFFPILILMSGIALSGCEGSKIYNGADHNVTYQQQHPIIVEHKPVDLTISVSAQKKGYALSSMDKETITDFIKNSSHSGGNIFQITAPRGGSNEKNMNTALNETQAIFKKFSILGQNLKIQRPPANLDSMPSLQISHEQYVATPSDCSDSWSRNTADAYRNARWLGLGCATQNNLAVMLANPRDLIEMNPMDEGSGSRREKAVSNFQEGTATSASRGAEETASSSTNAK